MAFGPGAIITSDRWIMIVKEDGLLCAATLKPGDCPSEGGKITLGFSSLISIHLIAAQHRLSFLSHTCSQIAVTEG